ncbi:hypothetical protein [Caudoviricetes sp.]|nr:hypothetical protein [Caudoviricetes sp.]
MDSIGYSVLIHSCTREITFIKLCTISYQSYRS